MYDKGYLPVGASSSTYEDIKKSPEPDPLREEFMVVIRILKMFFNAVKCRNCLIFKNPRERPSGAPPTGRNAAYDFDEW